MVAGERLRQINDDQGSGGHLREPPGDRRMASNAIWRILSAGD